MFRNYLQVALRSLRRQRIYALINIVGLAIGIVSALLITTFVRYELSYESALEKPSQIYRVVRKEPGQMYLGSDQHAVLSAPLAKALETEIPEIEAATAFDDAAALLSVGDDHIYENGLLADDHFFQVFGYPVVQGDPQRLLDKPRSIALSKGLAERLFGSADAVGRVIKYGTVSSEPKEYTVSGLFADVPPNSHLQFEYVASILDDEYYMSRRDVWGSFSWYTYFRIRDGQNIDAVQSKISALPRRYYSQGGSATKREFHTQSALSVHLDPPINNDIAKNKGDRKLVYLLIAVGLAVLLLACANYTNLAIVTSVQRAKEVGVRKAVGAVQRQIVGQFLSQSLLMTTLATALALLVVAMVLPRFALFVDRDLSFFADGLPGIAVMTGVVIATVGLIGGLYPAFIAARMKPAMILKGPQGTTKMGGQLRRFLVTLQFVVSVTLIAATLVIFRQMQFVESKDMGYARAHIVTAQVQDPAWRNRYPEIEQTLIQHPNVIAISSSRSDPTQVGSYTFLNDWTDHTGEEKFRIYRNPVGYDFIDLYEIPVVRGRGFSRDYPSDESRQAVIINETAFQILGWQDLDGKYVARGDEGPQPVKRPVVGVVRDFHMHSLRQEVKPLMMSLDTSFNPRWDRMSIKIAPTGIQESLQFIEQTLRSSSSYPAQIQFIDDVFAQLYEQDEKLSQIVGLFTVVALFVGALGLFGLVAYTAEMRTKEIGLRKVLGASVPSILQLFARDYISLIVIASVIGTPIAYLAMNEWLRQFAYRIELGPFDFLLSIALFIIVAACSMIYQALRAATKKPVNALRYE